MAHYAFIDSNGIIVEVIAGKDEGEEGIDWEKWYSEFRGKDCKRTSYNTLGGQHPYNKPFRKNYAGIGYNYDSIRDAFIPPQPFPSWVLNEETCQWDAPIAMPADGQRYTWNESTTSWGVVSE